MRGKILFLMLPLVWGSAALSKPKPAKFRWTMVYDFRVDKVNGVPPTPPETYRHKQNDCNAQISEAEVAQILIHGITDSDGCTAAHVRFADGKISFDGACPKDKDGTSYTLTASGTYSDTALRIDVKARGQADGDDLEASGTVIGAQVGPC